MTDVTDKQVLRIISALRACYGEWLQNTYESALPVYMQVQQLKALLSLYPEQASRVTGHNDLSCLLIETLAVSHVRAHVLINAANLIFDRLAKRLDLQQLVSQIPLSKLYPLCTVITEQNAKQICEFMEQHSSGVLQRNAPKLRRMIEKTPNGTMIPFHLFDLPKQKVYRAVKPLRTVRHSPPSANPEDLVRALGRDDAIARARKLRSEPGD